MLYNYCPTSPSRLVRKLWTNVKGNDWQIKWNMSCFVFKYYRVLSKHWPPSCSRYRKCSIAMPWLGIALFTRVNSCVEVLINMVCEDVMYSQCKDRGICFSENSSPEGAQKPRVFCDAELVGGECAARHLRMEHLRQRHCWPHWDQRGEKETRPDHRQSPWQR